MDRFQWCVALCSAALFALLCVRLWFLRNSERARVSASVDVVSVISPPYLDEENKWPGHIIAMLPAVFANTPARFHVNGTWQATYRADGLPDYDAPQLPLNADEAQLLSVGEDPDDSKGRCRVVVALPRSLLNHLPPPPPGYPSVPGFIVASAKISARTA